MDAKQARELAEANLKGPVIEPILEVIYKRIKEAATKGHMAITHPFQGLRMMYPSPQQQEAVWEHLSAQGYKVKHHPDPDPGDLRGGGAYTEISWG